MNTYMKLIIGGFALMFIGGVLFLTSAMTKVNMPVFLVLLTYGFFIGFVMIIIGLIFYPKD